MNLFPEEIRESKEDLYLQEYKDKKDIEFSEWVEIRMETRKLISSYSGLRLKLAKELLKVEKSTDQKYRENYYKNFPKRYNDLISV